MVIRASLSILPNRLWARMWTMIENARRAFFYVVGEICFSESLPPPFSHLLMPLFIRHFSPSLSRLGQFCSSFIVYIWKVALYRFFVSLLWQRLRFISFDDARDRNKTEERKWKKKKIHSIETNFYAHSSLHSLDHFSESFYLFFEVVGNQWFIF